MSQPKDANPAKFFGAVLAFLRACRIQRGFIDYDTGVEYKQVRKLEREYLREWVPSSTTLFETLIRVDKKLPLEAREADRPLFDVIKNEDLEKIAQEVTDLLLSIPYPTTFYAQLRGIKLEFSAPLHIGGIALRNAGTAATPKNTLKALARGYVDGNYAPPLAPEDVVLEITVSGYSGGNVADFSPDKALSVAKEFVILADALGILSDKTPRRRWRRVYSQSSQQTGPLTG